MRGLADDHRPGLRQLLQPRRQVGGVAHRRVVHAQVVANLAHHHQPGVHADAHLHAQTALRLELAAEVLHGALHAQGGVYGPARAVFVGNGGAEQGHHAVAGVLVDGALEAVHLGGDEPEAVIHDLVHHFGIEVPGQGREAGRIGEEHGDLLAFPFQGTAGSENLVGQVFGRICDRGVLL